MLHKFTYFEPIHIHSFIFFTILSIIIISIPFFMKKDYKGIFTKALGFFILFAKVFDIWYRIAIEKEDWIFTDKEFSFTDEAKGTVTNGIGMDFDKKFSTVKAHKTTGILAIDDKDE